MKYQHKDLAAGRWKKLSLLEQMANIGTEFTRATNWQEKGNEEYSQKAIIRFLELLSLSLGDQKNKNRLKELCRVKETALDYFYGDNQYASSVEDWNKYFYPFMYACQTKS